MSRQRLRARLSAALVFLGIAGCNRTSSAPEKSQGNEAKQAETAAARPLTPVELASFTDWMEGRGFRPIDVDGDARWGDKYGKELSAGELQWNLNLFRDVEKERRTRSAR